MPQKRLRPGATIADISASGFNQMIEATRPALHQSGLATPPGMRYQAIHGRNQCGYTIEPGAPVLLGTWFPETTGFGSGAMGFADVYPCYFPATQAEANTLIGANRNLFSVGVCVGDGVGVGGLGLFAVSGIVEIKCSSGFGYVGPQPKSAAYQTTGKMFDTFGFARKLYDVGGGFAVCDLSSQSNFIRYELTQARQLPPNPTTANVAGIPSFVVDGWNCASWQANGDKGLALWFGNGFNITTPWCTDA